MCFPVTIKGDLEVTQSRNSTSTFSVYAKRDTASVEICVVHMEIYHRDSSGTYTLLDTWETSDLTTSFVQYTSERTINATFAENERLEIRFIGENQGAPV